VLVPFLGLFAFKYTFFDIGFASLAVKEFNSKTNICSTTTILFLKELWLYAWGCTLYVSRDTNFIFNFIATLF
jgi:hypothetical protein